MSTGGGYGGGGHGGGTDFFNKKLLFIDKILKYSIQLTSTLTLICAC